MRVPTLYNGLLKVGTPLLVRDRYLGLYEGYTSNRQVTKKEEEGDLTVSILYRQHINAGDPAIYTSKYKKVYDLKHHKIIKRPSVMEEYTYHLKIFDMAYFKRLTENMQNDIAAMTSILGITLNGIS